MAKMNPVVHFEMSADDTARAGKFYSGVFGWQMKGTGPEMGNYLLAGTQPVDDKMMPLQPGAINGGFYPRGDQKGPTTPHVVIQVEDLDEHMKKVADAGGRIEGEPMAIPGIGRFVMFLDTEGNRVGMLQPLPGQEVPIK
jgi:predicted enzyme related to lactoylglutathione lyase